MLSQMLEGASNRGPKRTASQVEFYLRRPEAAA